jgi:hypothetical protein
MGRDKDPLVCSSVSLTQREEGNVLTWDFLRIFRKEEISDIMWTKAVIGGDVWA